MTAAFPTTLPEPSGLSPSFVEAFLSALADRVVVLERDGRITCVSEAATLDLPPTLAAPTLLRPGVSYPDLCRRAEAAGFAPAGTAAAGVTALLQGKRPDLRLELTAAGRVLELQASALQTGGGAVVVHRDITLAAARLRKLAYSDALTGLNNRHYFLGEAESRLRRTQPPDHGAALVYLDLDGFKAVNDTHGHAVGDAVLKI